MTLLRITKNYITFAIHNVEIKEERYEKYDDKYGINYFGRAFIYKQPI